MLKNLEPSVFGSLTGREQDVIQLISKGLTSKEIARQLDLSYRTVEVHRSHIFKKLGVTNLIGLIEILFREREKLETELIKSQTILTTFLNTLPAMVFIKDENGQLLFSNHLLNQILPKGSPGGVHHHEASIPSLKNDMSTEQLSAMILGTEISSAGSDEKLFESHVFEINVDNNLTLSGGFAMDVTEKRQTEFYIANLKKHLDEAQKIAKLGSWSWNLETNDVIWSDELFRILGYSPGEIMPSYELFMRLVVDEDLPKLEAALKAAFLGTSPFDIDFRIQLPGGEVKILNGQGVVARNSDGKAISMSGTNQDLTKKKKLEAVMEKERQELQDLYENAPCGFHSLDANGVFLKINNTELSWIGFTREEVIGKKRITDFFTPSSQLKFQQNFPKFIENGYLDEVELELVHKNGSVRNVLVDATAIKDEDGRYICSRSVLHDITLTKKSYLEIEKIAYHDILTGLPNRLLLFDRFNQAISHVDRHGGLLAVCYLDLDGFKLINDLHGHNIGDELLQEIARRIVAAVRTTDTIARLGGDEFLLLLNVQDENECDEVLQRVLEEIKVPFSLDNSQSFQVRASIGLTLYPADNNRPEVLIRHADQAMYQVKMSGRGYFKKYAKLNSAIGK